MPQFYHLHLKGYVGASNFDPSNVDKAVADNAGQTLHVLINSLGGSLFAGLSIAAAFKRHGNVHVHFEGCNASAATIAAMGAAHISIEPSGFFLVHKASACVFRWNSMNADQLREEIKCLDKLTRELIKFDNQAAALYASRCKKSASDLLDLMAEEIWLTPKEAKAWGFVDEISGSDVKFKITDEIRMQFQEAGIRPPKVGISFSDKVRAIFSPQNYMKKTVITASALCAVLNLQQIESEDDAVSMSADQIAAINEALEQRDSTISQRDARIAELEARVAELEKEPAGTSSNPPAEPGASADGDDDLDDFVNTMNSCKDIMASLPTR